jgi:hypothetical protein
MHPSWNKCVQAGSFFTVSFGFTSARQTEHSSPVPPRFFLYLYRLLLRSVGHGLRPRLLLPGRASLPQTVAEPYDGDEDEQGGGNLRRGRPGYAGQVQHHARHAQRREDDHGELQRHGVADELKA